MSEFQTSPGMRDILAPESDRWRRFVDVFAGVVEPAGYELIVPPMMEDIGVFQRVGEATDVVSKEMYQFTDLGGRHVALRPEQTASVCRAFVQHRPTTPWKTWCAGPNFRYEKPQRGRYRQFDQVGIEVLGVDDPYLDVEVIALGWRFFEALGLRQVTLLLNSLGEPADRARYVEALRAHFEAAPRRPHAPRAARRSPATRCGCSTPSEPADAAVIAAAPQLADFLSDGAAEHFATVRAGLDALGIPYTRRAAPRARPRLLPAHDVRVRRRHARQRPERARRRRPLRRARRGARRPADPRRRVRPRRRPHAAGVRRRGRVRRAGTVRSTSSSSTRPAAARPSSSPSELRRAGRSADRAYDGRSMKAQMKAANRSGAAVAVIIGDDELAAGTAVVRPLRDGDAQTVVARTDLLSHLEAVLR